MSERHIAYTIASGRLFCDFADFHAYAEALLNQPILTHEFANEETWTAIREAYEEDLIATHHKANPA